MSVAPLSPRPGSRLDSRTRPGDSDAGALGAFESMLARSSAQTARSSGPRADRPDAVARTEHPAGRPADRSADHRIDSAGDDAGDPARRDAGRPGDHGVGHGAQGSDGGTRGADATRGAAHHRLRTGGGHGGSRRAGAPFDLVSDPAEAPSAAAPAAAATSSSPAPGAPSGPVAATVVAPVVLPVDGSVGVADEAASPAAEDSRAGKGPALAGLTGLGGFLARATAGRAGTVGGPAAATGATPASETTPEATPSASAETPAPAPGVVASPGAAAATGGAPATGHGEHRAKEAAAGTVATDLALTPTTSGQALTGQAARVGARSSNRSGDRHDGPLTAGPAAGATAGAPAAPVPGARAGETAGPQQAQPAGNPVLDQVLTVVPRLVQRGDGTSRLTLKLHPADLGEVHVTVTVKDGTVDVTLAAGARAKEALGTGSDRLRSLLEGLGHTSGQVVVRDLAGAAASSSSSGQSWGQPGQQPQQSSQQSQQWGQQGDTTFAGAGGAPGDGNSSGADGGPDRRLPGSGPSAPTDDVGGTARAGLGPHRNGRPGPTGPAGLDVTI